MRVDQLVDEDAVPVDPKEPDGPKLPCIRIHLGRTKTTEADLDALVLLVGRPVMAPQEWLSTQKSPKALSSAASTVGAISTGGR